MAQWVRQWESQAWVDQVDTWVSRVLTTYGVERTGELTLHGRSLSSVLFTTLTQAGPVYVKAPAPARITEADVVSLIAPRAEGHVVAPLAVEPDEGWLLTPATGHSQADIARTSRRRGDHSSPLTPRIMSHAAETQRLLSGMGPELAEAGLLAGLLPSELGFHAEAAVESHASLPQDHPLALPKEEADFLLKELPRVDEASDALTRSGVPETLVPGALSLSDVLIPSSRRSAVAFLGWGAARWSHPFSWVASLLQELSVRSTELELAAAMEAYLAGYTDHGSLDDLAALFGPAESLATLQQHQDLMDLLLAADPEDQTAGAPQAFSLLREIFGVSSQGLRRRH